MITQREPDNTRTSLRSATTAICFAFVTAAHPFVITDEASPLALLSTHLIRGEQCAEAPAGRGSVTLSLSGRGGGQTRLGSVLSVELSWLLIDQAASERPSLRTAPQR
jgi:hypothetical protein